MDLSLRLMPFQAKGVDFLVNNPRALLAWEPGVGKTPTAVRACVRVGAKRILVFCPVIATSVWREHFRNWSYFTDIRVLDAYHAVTPYSFIEGKMPFVCIVPYSRASMGSPVIAAAARFSDQWDCVILDEVHYLKSPDAKRTKSVYGKRFDLKGTPLEFAKHIWCLTGTPLLNGPHEYWTHIHALKPKLIEFPSLGVLNYGAFVARYCQTRVTSYGWRVVGTRNSTELAQRTKGFSHRLRTKDVLLDLPPLRVTTYPLPPDQVTISHELRRALEAVSELEGLDDDALLAAIQAGSVQFSTLRRLIGEAKMMSTATLADDILESGPGKLILFCHHRDVIRGLTNILVAHQPLVIHGDTSSKGREDAIHIFQTDPAARLIILGIEAASEAITLSAANNVLVMEPSPVPARNAQAIARAHRKGQRNPVLAQFVTLPGTFDATFMNLIARKTKDIMRIVDPDLVDGGQPQFPELQQEVMI